MGGKRRKLQLKQQKANGKGSGPKPSSARAFIPNRHSDKPLAAAGPASGGGFQQPQSRKASKKAQEQRQRQLQRNQENPTIPFDAADDRILLVGEGDLSFAASLVRHHRCRHVTATVLDRDQAELVAKYPSADANIALFHGEKPPPAVTAIKDEAADADDDDKGTDDGGDAQKATPEDSKSDDDSDDDSDADYDSYGNRHPRAPATNRLLYNTDATKLAPSLGKPHPFDRILFNFPHVGGKSTDVNRQVRYNQELLVAFFRRAVALLAPGGSIVVTLFDGEPYTLWNVKDLARHVGLQADASFRFLAAAYPGYRHARTLGVVRSKKTGSEEGGGAWRGEDRPARSYVFVRKGDVLRRPKNQQQQQQQQQQQAAKKRKRSGSDEEASSSEDDLDD